MSQATPVLQLSGLRKAYASGTEELKSVLAEFTQNFASSDQSGSKAGSEDTAAASSDEVEQEQIVRQKR